jgi:uncharacterized protein YbjT (DUF2867 family)
MTESQKKTVLVFGSTGLVGAELVQQLIESPDYEKLILVNRSASGVVSPKVTELLVEFEKITDHPQELVELIQQPIQVIFCSLGTTIKKARSPKAFYRVDHDYVLMTGQIADSLGASVYVGVSAIATDLHSTVYYSRVKAEAERDVSALPFSKKSAIHFVRPSLLLGDRKEFRFGERLAILTTPLFNWMMAGPLKRYKAIQASQVAASMIRFAHDLRPGVHVHENETLF